MEVISGFAQVPFRPREWNLVHKNVHVKTQKNSPKKKEAKYFAPWAQSKSASLANQKHFTFVSALMEAKFDFVLSHLEELLCFPCTFDKKTIYSNLLICCSWFPKTDENELSVTKLLFAGSADVKPKTITQNNERIK